MPHRSLYNSNKARSILIGQSNVGGRGVSPIFRVWPEKTCVNSLTRIYAFQLRQPTSPWLQKTARKWQKRKDLTKEEEEKRSSREKEVSLLWVLWINSIRWMSIREWLVMLTCMPWNLLECCNATKLLCCKLSECSKILCEFFKFYHKSFYRNFSSYFQNNPWIPSIH